MPRRPARAPEIAAEDVDNFDESDLREDAPPLGVWTGDVFRKLCQYPVIVEAWDKRLSGRVRRAYNDAFTDEERNTITRWQSKFAEWHLRSGARERVVMRHKTLRLLRRAVDFFATI